MNATISQAQFADARIKHRFDDEAGLLGHMLYSMDAVAVYRAASAVVDYSHFSVPIFSGVFYEIGEAINAGATSTASLVRHVRTKLGGNSHMIDLFGTFSGFLSTLSNSQIIPLQLEATAKQIKREWLVDCSDAARHEQDFESVADLSKQIRAMDAGAYSDERTLMTLGGIADKSISHLNDIFQTGVIEGFAYAGSADIESVIGGWKPGRYYVIGARPSMGKSTFGMSMLRRTASKGHGVLVISLEMTMDEMGAIALCDTAMEAGERIEYRDVQPDRFLSFNEGVNRKRLESLIDAQDRLKKLPLAISDKAGMSISDIRAAATKQAAILAAQGRKLEVILIDHLNLIKPDDRYKGVKSVETEQISNQLKVMAKELGVAVVCLVQLNRGVEGRDDKMPSLADLRWSGAIEQDADVVMFLYRKAYYLERKREEDAADDAARLHELNECKNDLDVLFAKNRGGPCPLVRLWCDMGVGAVRDMAK